MNPDSGSVEAVKKFARAGAVAIGELIDRLPDDVKHRTAVAVAAGAVLSLGTQVDRNGGSEVFLDLVDVAGTSHRILTVTAVGKMQH